MTTIRVLTVSDLHQVQVLYQHLEKAVERHKPQVVAIVGDAIDAGNDRHHGLSKPECARRLAGLRCDEVVFVRGNHEGDGWLVFSDSWRKTTRSLHALNGEAFVYGPLVIVGFPCALGDEIWYLQGRSSLPLDVTLWFPQILREFGPACRTLWLMHEPPKGTSLTEEQGPLSGVREWAEAIERYAPYLTVSGHDHRTPQRRMCWRETFGQTVCLNLGQKLDGPLHYALIEVSFELTKPVLPSFMKVTAYPYQQSVVLPVAPASQ
jgi:Icc-related predicted phosphoesterase